MDDMSVCSTMCLDIIDRCNSRSEMLHTRDSIGALCLSIKWILEKMSNTPDVLILRLTSPDGL